MQRSPDAEAVQVHADPQTNNNKNTRRRVRNANHDDTGKRYQYEAARRDAETHRRVRDEDLGLVAIVLRFLSRDGLEADLHHVSRCLCPSGRCPRRLIDDNLPAKQKPLNSST